MIFLKNGMTYDYIYKKKKNVIIHRNNNLDNFEFTYYNIL